MVYPDINSVYVIHIRNSFSVSRSKPTVNYFYMISIITTFKYNYSYPYNQVSVHTYIYICIYTHHFGHNTTAQFPKAIVKTKKQTMSIVFYSHYQDLSF